MTVVSYSQPTPSPVTIEVVDIRADHSHLIDVRRSVAAAAQAIGVGGARHARVVRRVAGHFQGQGRGLRGLRGLKPQRLSPGFSNGARGGFAPLLPLLTGTCS